ncbi:MAG: hypothetical protein Q4A63_02680 [Butyricicoccus pullicaecorum]|nr:hypothetical protein [Butyricicoccus pullicaecorum]
MLTFDEFERLPMKEKAERYVELSDEDKFFARISYYEHPGEGEVIHSTKKEDIEVNEKFMRELKQAIKEGKVNLLQRSRDQI